MHDISLKFKRSQSTKTPHIRTANMQLPGPRANNGCLLSIVDGIGGGKQAYYFFSMPWDQMLFKVIFHLEKVNMPRQASLLMQVKILQLFQVLISTIENRRLWMAGLCLNQRLWTRHDVSWSVICGGDESQSSCGSICPWVDKQVSRIYQYSLHYDMRLDTQIYTARCCDPVEKHCN